MSAVTADHDRYLATLAQLVSIDSGSGDAEGIRAVVDALTPWLVAAGATLTRVPSTDPATGRDHGDTVVAEWTGTGTARIVMAGHLDTVFPRGEAAARPFHTLDGGGRGIIAHGPGVCDDIGGVLTGVAAMAALQRLSWRDYASVRLVCTPDEEIGTPAGKRPLLEAAAGAHAALGLECARADGSLVVGRKGVADVVVEVHGRAAHAGIEPERGASAVLAAADLIPRLHTAINGRWPDVTLNIGVVRAGERTNIVPDRAVLECDLRAADPAHFRAAVDRMAAIAEHPGVPGTRAEVRVTNDAVPWATRPADAALADLATAEAARHGWAVSAVSTGGCGDANHLSAVVPAVLDGLGPVGGCDHAPDEYLELDTVVPRTALLAGLVARISATHPGA